MDIKSFDNIRERLKVRLFPSDFAAGSDADVITRPFAHDILSAITVDLPSVVQTVTSKAADGWGISTDDLFEAGYRNVHQEEQPTAASVPAEDGVDVLVLEAASFFTATWVKWLDELVELPEEGAILGLPIRHMIVAHPLRDSAAMRAVNSMIPLIRRVYDLGPGSLSRHLYWWIDGELRWLPAHVSEEKIEFYPPNDFVDALNRVVGNS